MGLFEESILSISGENIEDIAYMLYAKGLYKSIKHAEKHLQQLVEIEKRKKEIREMELKNIFGIYISF